MDSFLDGDENQVEYNEYSEAPQEGDNQQFGGGGDFLDEPVHHEDFSAQYQEQPAQVEQKVNPIRYANSF